MKKVIAFLLLLLLPFTFGMTLTRNAVYDVDGTTDMYYIAGNDAVQTAMSIEGTGSFQMVLGTSLKAVSADHTVEIVATSPDDALIPLTVVLATKSGEDKPQVYAVMFSPDRGHKGYMEHIVEAVTSEKASLKVSSEVLLEKGVYKHLIQLFNGAVSLYERFDASGRIKFRDSLLVKYFLEDTVTETVVE
jgi:hypothetical protein